MTLPMAANMSYSPMLSEADVKVEALSKTCSSAHVSEARGTRATTSPGPTAQPATVTVRGTGGAVPILRRKASLKIAEDDRPTLVDQRSYIKREGEG